jgi:chromosome segregation ATPase
MSIEEDIKQLREVLDKFDSGLEELLGSLEEQNTEIAREEARLNSTVIGLDVSSERLKYEQALIDGPVELYDVEEFRREFRKLCPTTVVYQPTTVANRRLIDEATEKQGQRWFISTLLGGPIGVTLDKYYVLPDINKPHSEQEARKRRYEQ